MKKETVIRNDTEAMIYLATVDPDSFCENILNCPNEKWQSETMCAIADLDRVKFGLPTLFNHELKTRFTIASMHGSGKTHFIAKLMHWFNFTRKGRIPCTAPKEKQLTTRTWPEFRKILNKSIPEYRKLIKVDTKAITWFGDVDWCAIAETAVAPENLAGYHDDNLMFLCEEASGINNNLFSTIEGALTTQGAILVLIGNPTQNTGEFYDSHNKIGVKELYYTKQIKHHETSRISQDWVDSMIRKYGRSSPVVKIRVFGEFADSAPNQLLSVAWIERAIGQERNDGSHPTLRVICDVAAGGVDDTIIMVVKRFHTYDQVIKMLRFNFPQETAVADTREAVARVFDAYDGSAAKGDDIVIDCVGVGDGAGAELVKAHYPVIRYKGGEQADDPQEWRNRRVQSYICLRNALRDDELIYDSDFADDTDIDDYYAQAVSVLTKNDSEKLEDLETKKEMLARGEKSPDMTDCTSMLYATQTPHFHGSSTIETIGELESAHDEQW